VSPLEAYDAVREAFVAYARGRVGELDLSKISP
jgi:hypothetical protein